MKKIMLSLLSVIILTSCSEGNSVNNDQSDFYSTVVIDSCEYVTSFYKLAHKGNCKFCAERRKKELENNNQIIDKTK